MCAAAVWCAVHSGWQNGGKLSAPVAGRSPVEEPGCGNAGGPAGAEPLRAEKGRAGPAAGVFGRPVRGRGDHSARRVVGADLSAACAERKSDCVLVLSCRKGCFLRTVPAGENPALWLLDIIRRTAANKPQAEGTGFLPARRAAKKDVLPSPQPKRHPLRRVCMTLLVLALLAALAAVGAWKYTNGNFYALPEQLRALLTEHVPRPGATLV